MPHDRHGTLLTVGDVVMLPCIVKKIELTEDYCNVTLETQYEMPPGPLVGNTAIRQSILVNSKQVERPAHR